MSENIVLTVEEVEEVIAPGVGLADQFSLEIKKKNAALNKLRFSFL